ncbi:hypothetical protein C1631_006845 [Chryseobacterium phosphatilyticum]|uniref:Uncharacterized protein n=2 Tax=Chryseobacterium phosphatilyticum TaxID=475075 RepID=A0A316XGI8_9FLAO|nr:hypothetical protein C1631_006845 [Chryseobacterium phosphatilyticum]
MTEVSRKVSITEPRAITAKLKVQAKKINFKKNNEFKSITMEHLKSTLTICFAMIFLISCTEKSKTKVNRPTLKKEIMERTGYTEETYSKVYKYYWVTEDTSDLKFDVYERKADSTVMFSSEHHKQIDFAVLLDSVNGAFTKINSDFDLSKLESLIFKQPLYYPDLNRELSQAYEARYGKVAVDYPTLQQFLLSAPITLKINTFLKPLNKKVKSYSIEKFHLLSLEQIKKFYPDMQFENDPDFTLFGSGIYVELENKVE